MSGQTSTVVCVCLSPVVAVDAPGAKSCQACGLRWEPRHGSHYPHAGKVIEPQFRATLGRNDLCPCRSGMKFKRCHGRP